MDRMNRRRRLLLLLLAAGMTLCLSACRVRTTGSGLDHPVSDRPVSDQPLSDQPLSGNAGADDQAGDAEETAGPGAVSEKAPEANQPENGETDRGKNEESGARTRENPDASRKEYDENAPVEVVPGTGRLLNGEGEGDTAGPAADGARSAEALLNGGAEKPAVQTSAVPEAENRGVSEDADRAESALTYFTVLLEDRGGALYECQRAALYWETAEDHVTVHKSSPEHALILGAGAYDVSARLLAENLRVDDGWVVRKNPQVIVKIADSSVLGGSVRSAAAAEALCRELTLREGWSGIDAVKNRRVLILSRELLEAPYWRTAAMLMIAKTANPELYADIDLQQALEMLAEEAAGTIPGGIYYYSEEGR